MCMILRVMKMQSSSGRTFWAKINVKFCWYLMTYGPFRLLRTSCSSHPDTRFWSQLGRLLHNSIHISCLF
ncbi:hypothetical protein Hanom_Chr17g01550101 [Helianthus anomalus]